MAGPICPGPNERNLIALLRVTGLVQLKKSWPEVLRFKGHISCHGFTESRMISKSYPASRWCISQYFGITTNDRVLSSPVQWSLFHDVKWRIPGCITYPTQIFVFNPSRLWYLYLEFFCWGNFFVLLFNYICHYWFCFLKQCLCWQKIDRV